MVNQINFERVIVQSSSERLGSSALERSNTSHKTSDVESKTLTCKLWILQYLSLCRIKQKPALRNLTQWGINIYLVCGNTMCIAVCILLCFFLSCYNYFLLPRSSSDFFFFEGKLCCDLSRNARWRNVWSEAWVISLSCCTKCPS